MTLTGFTDYSELFRNCIWYSDNSLRSDGNLANLVSTTYGTKTGSPTITGTDRFGKSNKALNGFTGANYWLLPTELFTDNSNLTISVWIKYPATINKQNQVLGPRSSSSGNCGLWLHLHSNGTHMEFYDFRINPTPYLSSNIINDASWHHWVVQTNKSTGAACKMYIDGTFKASGDTFSAGGGTYTMCIGSHHQYSNYYYSDCIGDMMIFNTLLSAPEIKTLYELTSKKYLYPVQSGVRSCE